MEEEHSIKVYLPNTTGELEYDDVIGYIINPDITEREFIDFLNKSNINYVKTPSQYKTKMSSTNRIKDRLKGVLDTPNGFITIYFNNNVAKNSFINASEIKKNEGEKNEKIVKPVIVYANGMWMKIKGRHLQEGRPDNYGGKKSKKHKRKHKKICKSRRHRRR
jgi:hypothetical protein